MKWIKNRILWLWRVANCVFAKLMGYCWRQCPTCLEWFGGHEVAKFFRIGICIADIVEDNDPPVGVVVCRRCHLAQIDHTIQTEVNYAKHLGMVVDPTMHFALMTGVTLVRNGRFVGVPPMSAEDYRYFSRLSVLAMVIIWLFLLCSISPWSHSPWTNIGAALGMSLYFVVFRKMVLLATRPALACSAMLFQLSVVTLNCIFAYSKWRGRA